MYAGQFCHAIKMQTCFSVCPVMRNAKRTIQQVETAQGRAIRAAETLLDDDDLADDLADLSPAEYAARRGWEIINGNPIRRTRAMARKAIEVLEREISELQEENEELRAKLETIEAVFNDDDSDDGEEDDDGDDDDADSDNESV